MQRVQGKKGSSDVNQSKVISYIYIHIHIYMQREVEEGRRYLFIALIMISALVLCIDCTQTGPQRLTKPFYRLHSAGTLEVPALKGLQHPLLARGCKAAKHQQMGRINFSRLGFFCCSTVAAIHTCCRCAKCCKCKQAALRDVAQNLNQRLFVKHGHRLLAQLCSVLCQTL